MDELLRPLAYAFWLEVMEDLAKGDLLTYLWLHTGSEATGFVWWCEVTDKDVEDWQALLLRLWSLRGTEGGLKALRAIQTSAGDGSRPPASVG